MAMSLSTCFPTARQTSGTPLRHNRINMLVRYTFSVPETVANGELRPLRNPADDA